MAASFTETISSHTLNIDLSKVGKSAPKEDLTTLCTDIFLIIIRMRESEDLGEPAPLRKLLLHFIELFRKNCRAMNLNSGAIDDAVYALVALLDETVMSIEGKCRDFWVANPVQLELFGDNLAGEGFFRKLDALMKEPEKSKDLLELYYICLALGFQGKYRLFDNPTEREETINTLARLLLKIGNYPVSGLSPHGRRSTAEKFINRRKKNIPLVLIVSIACGVLVFACWLVMFLMTGVNVGSVLSNIR